MKNFKHLTQIICTAILLFYSYISAAQQSVNSDTLPAGTAPTNYWQTKSSFGLNFSQVKLANWAGGGQSSVSVNSLINLSADYARGKSIWENKLDMAYGLMRQGDDNNAGFRKTDDLLNFISKYNYNIVDGFFITALTDFRTQMDVGYNYSKGTGEAGRVKISEFMAPGFLVSSLGATYKKGKMFSLTLSPFTSKFTFVLDDSLSNAGSFGVERGSKVRSELGSALRSSFEKELYTNINFRTNLNLFANYRTFSQIDVNWEGILLLKVNNYISSTVSAQLIYDHDIIQKTQWRNSINVGFLLEI